MRILISALALAAAAVSAAPARDWSVVAAPAAGPASYTIGNPAAKVHLVEYLSYTCPHCAHFNEESGPVLRGQMIRSGSVRLEVRNLIADKADLTAATLARCVGPRAFARYHELVFARQRDWVTKAVDYDRVNAEADAKKPIEVRMRTLAQASGLNAIAREAGASPQAITACFANRQAVDKVAAAAQAVRSDVRGTPTFEINGTLVERVGWLQLEPMLRDAGAK